MPIERLRHNAGLFSCLPLPMKPFLHLPPRAPAWLCLVLLGWSLAACSRPQAQTPPPSAPAPEVGVVVLRAHSQPLQTVLPGRARASLSAEVRPQVSGIVQKRLFAEGETVRPGQPLYQLNAELLQAQLDSARAALEKARASVSTREAAARRNEGLVQIDAISQQALEESRAALAQARADVALARASVQTARIQLKYSRVEAPIGGRTGLSSVTPGALVTASQAQPLTTIVQLDPMHVDLAQSSSELLQLRRDWQAGHLAPLADGALPVRIVLEDGSEYPHVGRLEFSGVIVDSGTGNVTLRAVLPNPDETLLPGMYVQAIVPTGVAHGALLLPQRAVLRDPGGRAHVLVVTPDDVLEQRTVALDRALGDQWLLRSGVQAGERVVVEGFQRARPGDAVRALLQEAAPDGVRPAP